jgi:hypothetical protein
MNITTDGSSRRVLLFAPRFFGYDHEIADELIRQGAHVDLLPDRPYNTASFKAATRVYPPLTTIASERFYRRRLEELGASRYDQVLVVQGESISSKTLRLLRASFPGAEVVFYTWDSLKNKPFTRANLAHYDRCLTFDPADSKAYGMVFRPLFFTQGFERSLPEDFKIDLSFIGTIHSDRYRVIRQIADSLPAKVKTYWYLYLQAPWMYWARKLFTPTVDGSRASEFHYVPLASHLVQRTFFDSRAILDVQHPRQGGLTMRTIETLGSSTKLITTNSAVRSYDFFNPENICVIDRLKPVIPPGFLETPFTPVPDAIYQRYRLTNWVREFAGR